MDAHEALTASGGVVVRGVVVKGVFSFLFLLISLNATSAVAAQKIVTLSPVVAEWVAEILGEKETLKRVIGVTEFSQYPRYLTQVKSVGPYPQLHIEEILKLKPDLVLAVQATNQPEQIEKLKRLKLPVTVLKKESFDGMGEWIVELGRVLGEEARAKAVKDRWEFELKALEPGEKSTHLFLELQDRPLVTIGAGSFLNAAFKRVGFSNIFDDLPQDYPKVSREAVVKRDPDQILILNLNGDPLQFDRSRREWEKFERLKAVKDGKVRIIPGDDFARCSMRLLKALKSLK